MVKVSIVIPGHNALRHFEDCLDTIFSQDFDQLEVIWVDSASTDDSVRKIQVQFPQVKIIELTANAGYRSATNIGAREAQGKHLVVCNQDTRLEKKWLMAMAACIEADPKIGIVAPKILMFDNPQVINEAGNTLHYAGLYGSRGLGMPATEYSVVEPIATMSGCCFLVRHSLWIELGGFSEDFDQFDTGWHASFEDVDLAWRVQLAGFKIVLCPTALMYHKYEWKGMPAQRFCGYEWGRYLVVLRNYESPTLLLLFPILVALECGAWIYACARGRQWLMAKGRLMCWLVTNITKLREMRQRVQKVRRVRDSTLIRRMSPTLRILHIMPSNSLIRLSQRVLDGASYAYWRFLLGALMLLDPLSSFSVTKA